MDEMTDYGPAMRALPERKRRFVLAMASDPFGYQADWARAAGYSDESGRATVTASELLRDPQVQAASYEVSRAHMMTLGPVLAAAGLLRIARDRSDPKHFRALETLANRVGLHETSEHRVSVEHTDRTGVAMVERIKRLAADLGVDPGSLLGVQASAPLKVIEGKVEE